MLGDALLEWTERRERELGHPQFHQLLAAQDSRGRALVERGGYRIVRHVRRMVRALDLPSTWSAPQLPAGTTIRTPDPERDASALHALDDVSFSDAADYVGISLTAFIDNHLRPHDLDLSLELGGRAERRARRLPAGPPLGGRAARGSSICSPCTRPISAGASDELCCRRRSHDPRRPVCARRSSRSARRTRRARAVRGRRDDGPLRARHLGAPGSARTAQASG